MMTRSMRTLLALAALCALAQSAFTAVAAAALPADAAVAPGEPYLFIETVAGSGTAYPRDLRLLDGVLLYIADYQDVEKVWRSDGTGEGTYAVKTVTVPSVGNDLIEQLTVAGGRAYFSTCDSGSNVGPYKLWATDGTLAGTVLVKDLAPGGTFYSPLTNFTDVGGTLFFAGRDDFTFDKPWRSDGTTAGTLKLSTARVLTFPYEGPFGAAGGRFYFPVDRRGSGALDDTIHLWSSDGTPAGTAAVREDLILNYYLSFPYYSAAVGETFYFGARDSAGAWGLWKTDGTPAGTSLVRGGYAVADLAGINGTLYFRTSDETHGSELWKSDGAPAGTVMVKDINPSGSSSPTGFTFHNGAVYFSAHDGSHGYELWRTDGTAAGTWLVKDIYAGEKSSNPGHLLSAGDRLYFTAVDAAHGSELWSSDGTAAGTRLVKDIRPGSSGGVYTTGVVFGDRLAFQANDGANGIEIWAMELPVTRYTHLPLLVEE